MLYGKPKVGKTELCTRLEGNLIADCEDGSAYFETLYVTIESAEDIDELFDKIIAIGKIRKEKGLEGEALFPYQYITLDTVDAFEAMCEKSATEKYKASGIGKTFTGESVTELANGNGYQYLRKELMAKIIKLSKVCKGLILLAHIREKFQDKGGEVVSTKELSLTGKLSGMVCAKADAIGYLFRDKSHGGLMVSFETLEENSIMGGRCPHLAGKVIPAEWDKIYID